MNEYLNESRSDKGEKFSLEATLSSSIPREFFLTTTLLPLSPLLCGSRCAHVEKDGVESVGEAQE